MAKLKAFVRIDGTGRVVPGTLLLRYKKPGVGNWMEIDSTECCNFSPSSGRVAYNTFRSSLGSGCIGRALPAIIYLTQECIDNPQIGCEIWEDEAGTIPAASADYRIGVFRYIRVIDGIVTLVSSC